MMKGGAMGDMARGGGKLEEERKWMCSSWKIGIGENKYMRILLLLCYFVLLILLLPSGLLSVL
jgi:hypothetical protein